MSAISSAALQLAALSLLRRSQLGVPVGQCVACRDWPEIVVLGEKWPAPMPRYLAGCDTCGHQPLRIRVIEEVQPIVR
jgi:hypothetical protein